MKYIFSFGEITDEIASICGGKGASLAKLTEMRLPVPEGFVLTANAFSGGEIKPEALNELEALVSVLSDKHTYAVRSSALNEDGENASFAGAYETITNAARNDIISAVRRVAASADSLRVRRYAENTGAENGGIAVVIQRFVKPEFAGVVFTSNPISGSAAVMQGNYVKGEGEALVSGAENAEEFTFNAMKYAYGGKSEFERYAKRLFKCCARIRNGCGKPMDIEWAVSGGKVYILQARPITSLRRVNAEKFEVNGSFAGKYLLSKTNVGEIFMRPVSPVTFGVLETICDMTGIPFIDNICGQPYANLSVICSFIVSLGFSEKSAVKKLSEIAGELPQGLEVPIFPFDKKIMRKKIRALVFGSGKDKISRAEKREIKANLGEAADKLIAEIRGITDSKALLSFWETKGKRFISGALGAIMKGANVIPLFGTKKKISRICGEELANELCSGGAGTLDSMKPLLLLEDVIAGKMTRDEYIKLCGHRHVDEMELSAPYPYENPDFPENIIGEHIKSGVNVRRMRAEQEARFNEAVLKFKKQYRNKSKWLDKTLSRFKKANLARENVRSRSVKLFCMMREFLLKAGELSGVGEDIFMLYFGEVLELLKGEKGALANIPARRKSYEENLAYPPFPNLICGRFEPKKWLADERARRDFYSDEEIGCSLSADIKGFSGAAGVVTGRVRVIFSADNAEELQTGEILCAPATNIGWTVIFPRAAAIITDIGAPLSHAAIVAREFGIPAVVGCGNATTLLKTGDMVTVDGARGTVTLHTEQPDLDEE